MPGEKFAHLGTMAMSEQVFQDILSNPPRVIAVDTETISVEDKTLMGVGFAIDDQNAFYVPMWPQVSCYMPHVLNLLARPDICKCYHNLVFDLASLRRYGVDETNIADTLVIAHMAGLPLSLSDICDMHDWEIGHFPKGMKDTRKLEDGFLAKKNLLDTLATYKLWSSYVDKVDARILQEEMELIPILVDMSERGIKVDSALAQKYEQELDWQVRTYKDICEKEYGFNPGSPKQVGEVLLKRGNYLPLDRTDSGYKISTGEEILSKITDPLASLILTYRKVQKLKSTYVTPLVGIDRVHTQFTLLPATGRLSSRSPNMQNIPSRGEWAKIRNCYIPDDEYFSDGDFSQQELRILQYVSGDKAMGYVFTHSKCEDCGREQSVDHKLCDRCGSDKVKALDLHQDTATFLQIERKIAKNVNFAIVYDANASTVSDTAEINNVALATKIIQNWGKHYVEAFAWMVGAREDAWSRHPHYAVTLGGRKLWIRETKQHEVEKRGVNYCVPTNYKILTQQGWRTQQEVKVGDKTLGYHDGQLEWTEIRQVYYFPSLSMTRFYHRRFDAVCTEDHRWLTEWKVSWRQKDGTIVRTSNKKFMTALEMIDANSKNSNKQIILTSVANIEGILNINKDEAALLAWIVTDGHIHYNYGKSGTGKKLEAHIFQSPNFNAKNCCEIESLLNRNNWLTSVAYRGVVNWYRVKPQAIRDLWSSVEMEHGKLDGLDKVILNMPREARREFIRVVRLADGGKRTKYVAQYPGETANAFKLALYLEGIQPRLSGIGSIYLGKPFASTKGLKQEYLGEMEGWCVETTLGTWTMSDGKSILLTGNCIQGTGAEITKAGMRKAKHLDMRLQVHDELMFSGNVLDKLKALDLPHVSPVYVPVSYKLLERWE